MIEFFVDDDFDTPIESDPTSSTNYSDLIAVLQEVRADIKAVDRKYDELFTSVNFCSDKITDFQGTLTALSDRVKCIHAIKEENKLLKAEITRISTKNEELEQYSRLNNLEIQGVPESKSALLQ
ncbi:hypothetical protein QE152_g5559 [Popillia japonica]|uniref:Uncharacterized protein n=1 Tax=Popillia japonica TaxID=7064 RepID=A0AAW1MHS1_POPJA